MIVIRYSLDLDLRLLDTATGQPIPPPNVTLYRDGKLVHPMRKPSGHFILQDKGRSNFTLTVNAQGYLSQTLTVDYDKLNSSLPHITLQMVPARQHGPPYPILERFGNRPGLVEVSGVSLDNIDCFMQSYDSKKKIITLSNSHLRTFERQHFARLDAQKTYFEAFFVEKSITPYQLQVKDELEKEFTTLCPVAPICFGAVMSNGDYWFRVRDEGNNPRWLMRYQTADGDAFEAVDLSAKGGVDL